MSNSEQLTVFRGPREADGRMHQSMGEGRMHQSTDAKKIAWEGDKVSQPARHGQTSGLLDPIGPLGRIGEKDSDWVTTINRTLLIYTCIL